MERKITERMRRNEMKALCTKLFSLLPNQHSQETQSLYYQIDEAVKYIQSLQANLEKMKEEKEKIGGKRMSPSNKFKFCDDTTLRARSQIEIHEQNGCLEVVFTGGLDEHFMFRQIIGLIQEEDEPVEIVSAASSVIGSCLVHVLHAQVKNSGFGSAKLAKRLYEHVYGWVSEEVPSQEFSPMEFAADLEHLDSYPFL